MNKYVFAIAGAFLLLQGFAMKAYAQVDVNVGFSGSAGAQTEQQVQVVASHTLATDTNASDVAVTNTSVAMDYPVVAKLFGIFPVTLSTQVQVGSDGVVAVHYPWYAFLFSTDQTELQTKLKAVGQAVNLWNANTLTPNQQITLLSLIHVALQSNLQATVSTSGSLQ